MAYRFASDLGRSERRSDTSGKCRGVSVGRRADPSGIGGRRLYRLGSLAAPTTSCWSNTRRCALGCDLGAERDVTSDAGRVQAGRGPIRQRQLSCPVKAGRRGSAARA